jgi:nucleotide-binding universal stress UspA family protein
MSSEQSQVVVAFDFTHSGQAALYRAVALASRAPFHVLHFACILDPHAGIHALPTKHVDLVYADRVRDELAATVEQELKNAKTQTRVHFHIHVRIARHPAKELLEIASEVGADLIIVGCKGLKGVERVVLGSVSEHVVREAQCTVVIARPKEYAYVPHLEVVQFEHHAHARSQHHYTYEDKRATLRPSDWPMY